MASKTILKTNTLTVAIIIELILWITLSTIFGYLVGDHWYHLDAAAIVGFVFATLTTLAMLGLKIYGTSKKHMESMNACVLIRSIRCMIFLCIAVAVGQGYYNQGLVTIFIICMLWDLMRIKSEVKIISLIKKENSESTKAQAGMDAEAQLESDQSLDLSFPKIIKSFFTEKVNEMNLLKNENTSEDGNTEDLTKKENNGSTSNKVLIQNEIIFFILFCTVFVLVIHEIEWGAFTDIVLYVLTILTTLVIWSLEVYGSSTKQLKRTKSLIACRSIRCLFFITLATLVGSNYYHSPISDMVSSILIAFCIAFILWDLLRIKSDVNMVNLKINLIKKANNNEKPTLTKTALKFDYDNHDKVEFESLEPAVSRIITNMVKEENNSKGTNTKVLIKKENNEDTNTTASINKDNNESANNTTKILDNELPILNSIQIQE